MSAVIDLAPEVAARPVRRLTPEPAPDVLVRPRFDLGPGFGRRDRVVLKGWAEGLAVLQSVAGEVAHAIPDVIEVIS